MKSIKIIDTTLCQDGSAFSFKEKIEIVRQLEKANTDVIELPAIQNVRIDTLLLRTVSTFLKNSVLSVAVNLTEESLENAILALSNTKCPRVRIELPVSPVGMEYICHKKPDKIITSVEKMISLAKEKCADVEFCAFDATRAEKSFLKELILVAEKAGACEISLCDNAGEMLPNDFVSFIEEMASVVSVPVNVFCDNKNGMACANAILAVQAGAVGVKTSVNGYGVPMDVFAGMIQNCGNHYGFTSSIRYTEFHRILRQVKRILDNAKNQNVSTSLVGSTMEISHLDVNDSREAVASAVVKLGYDISEDDLSRVYEEFLKVAEKKTVGEKELDAIVASVALQVPATYHLISYVVNSGNIISTSAQITLEKDGKQLPGVCIGDGPIDAAFRAIEQIIGCHYELDDFQIQSVTEGREAMGSALVKLRYNGRLYSGNGLSTDILGAGIRAYINAVNKIVYEEVNI